VFIVRTYIKASHTYPSKKKKNGKNVIHLFL
jgi:hypothetical protein